MRLPGLDTLSDHNPYFIGISGWSYPEWKGLFYPEKLAQKNFLDYYFTRFSTVEINSSFYHLPRETTFRQWYEKSPAGFKFAVKAGKFMTHVKKLEVDRESLDLFFDRVALLQEKTGPLLFQLPPKWGFDAERLTRFLKALPIEYRYAMEFRDRSWLNECAYEILQNHNVAFCVYDLRGFQSPKIVTSDLVYLRFHGPRLQPYLGAYGEKALRGWAGDFQQWASEGRQVWCYFDNTMDASAPQDALLLKELLAGKTKPLKTLAPLGNSRA